MKPKDILLRGLYASWKGQPRTRYQSLAFSPTVGVGMFSSPGELAYFALSGSIVVKISPKHIFFSQVIGSTLRLGITGTSSQWN